MTVRQAILHRTLRLHSAPTSQPWAGPPETPRDPSAFSVSQDTPSAGLFDDDLDGLADRMDEAHVYSMCTEAKDDAKTKKASMTQFHSVATELG